MKANVQKLIGMAVLGLVLFSNSIPAWAGAKSIREVTVDNNRAFGTTAAARYSSDSQQYIGCNLLKNGSPAILCTAQDKTGKYLFCTGYASKWMAVAKAITDSSQIYFISAPGNGNCTFLEVGNDSLYLK